MVSLVSNMTRVLTLIWLKRSFYNTFGWSTEYPKWMETLILKKKFPEVKEEFVHKCRGWIPSCGNPLLKFRYCTTCRWAGWKNPAYLQKSLCSAAYVEDVRGPMQLNCINAPATSEVLNCNLIINHWETLVISESRGNKVQIVGICPYTFVVSK